MNTGQNKAPFFIVGCGRSGTTLLRAMLNAHPEMAIPLESLFIADYLLSKQPLRVLKKHLINEYELKEWGSLITQDSIHDCQTPGQLIDRIHSIYAQAHGKSRWGQKTPRLVRCWQVLKRCFPDAFFIHLVRDPRAVACSLKNSEVHRSTVLHGAFRWRQDIRRGLELEKKYPDNVLRIFYEDLVREPYNQLLRVCRFLGVEFSESMLRFYKNTPEEYGNYYSQIHAGLGAPVSDGSAEKWRTRLSPEQVRIVEQITEQEMEMLGYKKIYQNSVYKPAELSKLYCRAVRLAKLPAQLNHYRKYRSGYLWCVLRRKIVLKTLGIFPVNR